MANIKVAVRVRPMSQKEASTGGRHVVHVQDNAVSITDTKMLVGAMGHRPGRGPQQSTDTQVSFTIEGSVDHRERVRHFAFDYAYAPDLVNSEGEGHRRDASKPRGHAKTEGMRETRKRPNRKDSRRGAAARKVSTGDGAPTNIVEATSVDQREFKRRNQSESLGEGWSEDFREGESGMLSKDQCEVKSENQHRFESEQVIKNEMKSEAEPEYQSEGHSEGTEDAAGDANWDQERVYRELGREVEVATLYGYNACVLAYGQSGSGKTYTILGHKDAPGLAPRMCEGLLTRLQERYSPDDLCAQDFSLSLSLVEIYNERVRDLLTESDTGRSLRVREHPHTGPYVDGVTRHPVTDAGVAWSLLERGRASRSVASTASHAQSSRSHALLTLDVTQPAAHTRSTLTLVDLAGSERASADVDKARLTEGASINRSLVTLGNVISALAERGMAVGSTIAGSLLGSNLSLNSTTSRPTYAQSYSTVTGTEGMPPHSHTRNSRLPFIPYRDSVLTWLLKDTLGGNAKTLMIATVSPSSTSFAESLSTLRYATRARCIVNTPVVNLDPGTATISSLRREVAALRRLLYDAKVGRQTDYFLIQ